MKWEKVTTRMPLNPGDPQNYYRTDGDHKVNGNFYEDENKELVFGVHPNGAHNGYDIRKEMFDRIEWLDQSAEKITGETSDGHHTFNELYDFRKVLNAWLFNYWHRHRWNNVHKSKKHYDGENCFGGGWFVVMAKLPTGLISFHYKMEDWDLFKIPIFPKAGYEYDGHTSKDVLETLLLELHLSNRQIDLPFYDPKKMCIVFLKAVQDNRFIYDITTKRYVAAWDNYKEYFPDELYEEIMGNPQKYF